MTFAIFREEYPLREMAKPAENEDQLRQMTAGDGMMNLESSSIEALGQTATIVEEPRDRIAAEEGRLLWVVRGEDTPVALEACAWGAVLESGVIKHSNLTGGGPAHSAGELWVVAEKGLLVTAGSGRYGANSEAELSAFVEALRTIGFRVATTGYDIENGVANRTVLGDLNWLEPHG